MEISFQMFNKKRLIKFIQAGDFEKAMTYLNACKKFIQDAEFNTVMRRIFYAYFPCLMLKNEIGRALKLVTEMENLGLYDQEAKLKYGDLLKFEKLSNVISRELVVNKCAEVVTKDLENVEDHFVVDKPNIPTKYETFDSTSYMNSMNYLFNFNPTKYTKVDNTTQMVVDNQPRSLWNDYTRVPKKKKVSHQQQVEPMEILETSEPPVASSTVTPATPSSINAKYSLKYEKTLPVFDTPIMNIIQTTLPIKGLPKVAFISRKDNNMLLRVFRTKDLDLSEYKYQPTKEFSDISMVKDLLPSITYGVNSLFLEIAQENKILLYKLDNSVQSHNIFDSSLEITTIFVQGDTSNPLIGTGDGNICIANLETKKVTPLANLGIHPVIKIMYCSENPNLRYVLLKNGQICRVEIADGKILPETILSSESSSVQNSALPDMLVHPQKPSDLLVKHGATIHSFSCNKNKNGTAQFTKLKTQEFPDMSSLCYNPNGNYLFVGRTNGTISLFTSANFLDRGNLINLTQTYGSNTFATHLALGENNSLLVGTNTGSVLFFSLVENEN